MKLSAIFCIKRKVIVPSRFSHVWIRYEPFAIDREFVLSHAETPSARDIKLARKGPQYHCRADCLNRSITVFESAVHDGSNTVGRCNSPCQSPDCLSRNASNAFYNLRSKMLNIPVKLVETHRPVVGKILIVQFLFDNYVAQPESKSRVRARSNWYPFRIGVFGHHRSPGVYYHDTGTSLMCLLNLFEVVRWTVCRRILAPDHNEFGVLYVREHIDEHASHRHMRRYHCK